jgi:hypothetical protein
MKLISFYNDICFIMTKVRIYKSAVIASSVCETHYFNFRGEYNRNLERWYPGSKSRPMTLFDIIV